jgi:hypothetical protein
MQNNIHMRDLRLVFHGDEDSVRGHLGCGTVY